jgi:hypothetical protein
VVDSTINSGTASPSPDAREPEQRGIASARGDSIVLFESSHSNIDEKELRESQTKEYHRTEVEQRLDERAALRNDIKQKATEARVSTSSSEGSVTPRTIWANLSEEEQRNLAASRAADQMAELLGSTTSENRTHVESGDDTGTVSGADSGVFPHVLEVDALGDRTDTHVVGTFPTKASTGHRKRDADSIDDVSITDGGFTVDGVDKRWKVLTHETASRIIAAGGTPHDAAAAAAKVARREGVTLEIAAQHSGEIAAAATTALGGSVYESAAAAATATLAAGGSDELAKSSMADALDSADGAQAAANAELLRSLVRADTDRNGILSVEEIMRGVPHCTEETAKALIRAFDKNGDGVLELAELPRPGSPRLEKGAEAQRALLALNSRVGAPNVRVPL